MMTWRTRTHSCDPGNHELVLTHVYSTHTHTASYKRFTEQSERQRQLSRRLRMRLCVSKHNV